MCKIGFYEYFLFQITLNSAKLYPKFVKFQSHWETSFCLLFEVPIQLGKALYIMYGFVHCLPHACLYTCICAFCCQLFDKVLK